MYTYLKFGLPRVFPPNGGGGSQRSHHNSAHHQQTNGAGPSRGGTPGRIQQHNGGQMNRGYRDSSVHHLGVGGGAGGGGGPAAGSSGYDSSDNETTRGAGGGGGAQHVQTNTAGRRVPSNLRKFRSESDFRAMNGHVLSVSDERGGAPSNHRGSMMAPAHSSRAGSHMPSHLSHHQQNHHQHQQMTNEGSGGGGVPLAALRMANSRASIAGITHTSHLQQQYGHMNQHHLNQVLPVSGKHYGMRSHSEADLLGNEQVYDYDMR